MTDDRLSPRAHALGVLTVAVFTVFAATPLRAQRHVAVASVRTALDGAKTPNAFATGDSVDVEYARRGDWIPARVTDVVNDGYAYTVDLAPYDDGKIISAQIHYSRVRAHARTATVVAAASAAAFTLDSLPLVAATSAATPPTPIAVVVPPTLECVALAGCEPTPYVAMQQGTAEAPAYVPSPQATVAPPGPSAIPPAPILPLWTPLALAPVADPFAAISLGVVRRRHSSRSVASGSTRAARHAGSAPAITQTTARRAVATRYVAGTRSVTP